MPGREQITLSIAHSIQVMTTKDTQSCNALPKRSRKSLISYSACLNRPVQDQPSDIESGLEIEGEEVRG